MDLIFHLLDLIGVGPPKIEVFTPQIIHLFIGFSIIFTIHFWKYPYFWKHPGAIYIPRDPMAHRTSEDDDWGGSNHRNETLFVFRFHAPILSFGEPGSLGYWVVPPPRMLARGK